jgi:hypothetical protein
MDVTPDLFQKPYHPANRCPEETEASNDYVCSPIPFLTRWNRCA